MWGVREKLGSGSVGNCCSYIGAIARVAGCKRQLLGPHVEGWIQFIVLFARAVHYDIVTDWGEVTPRFIFCVIVGIVIDRGLSHIDIFDKREIEPG